MLDAIQRFFQETLSLSHSDADDRPMTLELATAALLCEVVRADYHHDDRELAALREMLERRFHRKRAGPAEASPYHL